jgi:hypothetical protein
MMSSTASMPIAEVLVGQLLMGGRGRVDDKRLCISHVGQVAEQPHRFDELPAGRTAALDTEGEDRPRPLGKVLLGKRVICVGGQPRVVDVFDDRMVLQELGHSLRIAHMAVHPDVQRLQSQQHQPCGHRRHHRPVVAEHLGAAFQQPAEVAEVLEEP